MFNFLRDIKWTPDHPDQPTRAVEFDDLYKIELVEKAEVMEKGEGLYFIHHLEEEYYMDMFDCMKLIEKILPSRSTSVMDRLQNFRRVFINTNTGEVST